MRPLASSLVLFVALLSAGWRVVAQSTPTSPLEIFVSPSGGDDNPGTSARPLRTLQKAFDVADAGTVITLGPGVYGAAATKRAGRPDAPIVVRGSETGRDVTTRDRTVIRGDKVVLQINHSYYRLSGFSVDGQPGIARDRFPTDLAAARPFKDAVNRTSVNSKLIYIGYAPESRDLTGIVLDDLYLHGAGGECVRMRNNAFGNVVTHTIIRWCGIFESGDDVARYRYHNGEGVYIGTSPKSTTQPMYANDTSHDNEVRDSDIATFGSECFQIKENAHHNAMRRVTCGMNDEPLSFGGSNVELRGDHNIVEDSTLSGSRGVNLKIAFDEPKYDKGGNTIMRNRFGDAAGPHVDVKGAQPLGAVCGNTFATARVIAAGAAFERASEPCRQ